MNRRQFLGNGGALSLLAAAAPALAARRTRVFGLGLFSIPKMLEADFAGAITSLAKLGYREVEPFGPYTFSDPAQIANWKSITPSLGFSGSGFFGKSISEAVAILRSNGMTAPSMHTDLVTLRTRMGALAEAAHRLGATYVVLPSIPGDLRKTLNDYRRMADVFNEVGASAHRHGLRFAYHNHGYGIVPIGDVVPLQMLIEATDPARVFLELDVYWSTAGGGNPIDYLNRYPGRYKMLHLKDMKGHHRFAGDGGSPSEWIPLFPYMCSLGQGSLDIKGILAAAERTGVEHYFVEQDRVDNPNVALRISADYLRMMAFK